MDDPWGSPWTAGETEKDEKPSRTRTPAELEPPPRAILTSNSTTLPTFSTQFAWGDDSNGFGEWSAPDPAAGTSASSSAGWGGWAGSDSSAAGHQLTPTPRYEGFGSTSPIAWPGSTATANSPAFGPISRTSSVAHLRQPSPDPWASEFHSDHHPTDRPANLGDGVALSVSGSPAERDSKPETSPPTPISRGVPLTSHSPTEEPTHIIECQGDEGDRRQPPQTESQEDTDQHQGAHVLDAEKRPTSSRLGSSASSDRHHNEDLQESPVTSIDEEQRTQPPIPQKQVPSKVQNLVEMYDGLSKVSEPDQPIPRALDPEVDDDHGPPRLRKDSASKNDAQNLREDSSPPRTADVNEAPDQDVTTAAPAPAPAPAPPTDDENLATQAEDGSTTHSRGDDGAWTEQRPRFPVDYQHLDKLFPLPPHSDIEETAGAVDSYVPDHVLIDSFTTIAERKTWYRVSRQGPLRKHNVGDDENYRRVVWAASTIREETMLVVRRWTEEDSFTGRPALGGAGSKGNIFGWDSKAEPVALDVVFRKQHASNPTALARSTSFPEAQLQPLVSAPTLDEASSFSQPKFVPPPAPVPQFGWSTGGMPPAAASEPRHTSQQTDVTWNLNPIPRTANASEPVTTTTASMSPVPDNDDEWGEMVTSTQGADDTQHEPSGIRDLVVQPSLAFEHSLVQTGVQDMFEPRRAQPPGTAPQFETDGIPHDNGEASTLLALSYSAKASPPSRPGLLTSSISLNPRLACERSLLADPELAETPASALTVLNGVMGESHPTSQSEIPSSVLGRPSTAASLPLSSNADGIRHDKAAARVVDGLPDMAYMFR